MKLPSVQAGALSYLGSESGRAPGLGRKALARVDGDVEFLGPPVKLFLPALDGPPPRRGGRPELERLKPALAGLMTEVAR